MCGTLFPLSIVLSILDPTTQQKDSLSNLNDPAYKLRLKYSTNLIGS